MPSFRTLTLGTFDGIYHTWFGEGLLSDQRKMSLARIGEPYMILSEGVLARARREMQLMKLPLTLPSCFARSPPDPGSSPRCRPPRRGAPGPLQREGSCQRGGDCPPL